MRVLVAGATGVLGRPLLPALRAAGHEVTGCSRRGGDGVRAVDVLDAAALGALVAEVRPEAVVNVLTAIPGQLNPRRIAQQFAPTNRLRMEGTQNLITAAPDALHVAESIAFLYDPAPGLATEDDAVWRQPPGGFVAVLAAVRELETATLAAGGTVLRMGSLYGPGTAFADGGAFARQARKRQLPVAGAGDGVLGFLHVDDAASAVVAVLATGARGVLNVVEDDPRPAREWIPAYARSLGAKPPRRVPRWLVRLLAGEYGVAFFDQLRGASNARAKERLGWAAAHRFPA